MKLTPDNKAYIDSLTLDRMKDHIRRVPPGSPWLKGETGDYWAERMRELRRDLT